jgi:hypothetical protein
MLLVFNFCISLYVHSQLSSHNVQNMVHYNYLVLFTSLCCTLDAGFRLREKAVGELCRLHTAFLHWPLSSAATKEVQGPDTT